jgi:hypothetical protein
MKYTDNPVVSPASPPKPAASDRGGGRGDDDDAGRKAAFSIGEERGAVAGGAGDGPDPLSGDKFLKGYFGR